MIPGFTTSVDCKGKSYQVQTEDKGVSVGVVVSLVYDKGTVVFSKRAPYSELIGADYDAEELSKRLMRQHRLLCAAVAAGKLGDLQRIGGGGDGGASKAGSAPQSLPKHSPVVAVAKGESRMSVKVDSRLRFFGGDERSIEVRVVRGPREEPVHGAQISIKVVGSAFRPQIFHAGTDSKGSAKVNLKIPAFATGRGAVVFKAVNDDGEAELRRVLRPGPKR